MADPKTKIRKHMGHGEAVRRGNSLVASLGGRSASDMAEINLNLTFFAEKGSFTRDTATDGN